MDEYSLHALQSGPKIVERILRVFPHDRLDDRIDSDRFTAREVVSHLADYEQTVLDRIRVANTHPGRAVPDYDADEHANAHHFGEKEVFHEAEVYESRRGMTIDYLNELESSDYSKTFVWNGKEISIADYLCHVLKHDLNHLEQISSYLATEAATLT